jgi:hypothetical protein
MRYNVAESGSAPGLNARSKVFQGEDSVPRLKSLPSGERKKMPAPGESKSDLSRGASSRKINWVNREKNVLSLAVFCSATVILSSSGEGLKSGGIKKEYKKKEIISPRTTLHPIILPQGTFVLLFCIIPLQKTGLNT